MVIINLIFVLKCFCSKYLFEGYLSCLWTLSLEDKIWTWMGGSDDKNYNGSESYPAARASSTPFIDEENQIIWILGGVGLATQDNNETDQGMYSYPIAQLLIRFTHF